MVKRTVAEFGRLDAAFNNAGVMVRIAPTAQSTLYECVARTFNEVRDTLH